MISAVGGVDGLGGAFGDLAEAGHDRGKRKKKSVDSFALPRATLLGVAQLRYILIV